MRRVFAFAALLPALLPATAAAQGRTDYFNVESPQVKPITVARLDGHDYLLICNTPDNSLEIWDTNESLSAAARFKGRVGVGLEPVSVAWDPTLKRAYTANFLGDSISMIGIGVSSGTVQSTLITTRDVGDEPMDIAISGSNLFVTHTTTGGFGWRSTSTLDPVTAVCSIPDMALIDPNVTVGATTFGLKEPRAVRVDNGLLYVLGFKGGNNAAVYDFDIYIRDLASCSAPTKVSGLGSTNFNMTFDGTGDLWVVGGEALNATAGEAAIAAEPSGFVKSTVYLIQNVGTGSQTITVRDLNSTTAGTPTPVTKANALAQPTDVAVFDNGTTRRAYITAFGSDRVGVLTAGSISTPYAWTLTRIAIPVATGSSNPRSGPRSVVVKPANGADANDPGDRVYVVNRLDNSFAILDPSTDTHVATIALANDPTPAYIRTGREFLYSADESGSGFVSCASCHMDARTDSLLWDLSEGPGSGGAYPPGLVDGLFAPVALLFVDNKGPMVTQSLQGLLNYEVDPTNLDLFTNAPYHWRGDRASFVAFAGAFQNLMGASSELGEKEMTEFEIMINSVNYPPNPYQPANRVYSGDEGSDPSDETDGTDAQLGLKLFHIRPLDLCAQRSCVQCHALPEGSNNRTTTLTGAVNPITLVKEPIETAAMRGLFQREALQDRLAGTPSTVVTGEFGLTHDGARPSLNNFENRFASEFDPAEAGKLLAIKHFIREFDFCVAPLVGRPYTVTNANNSSSTTTTTLILFERQVALANVGLAAYARIGGVETGYWFDLTATPPSYCVEGGSTHVSRATLLASCTGVRDRIIFQATPLGSDRRVAALDGIPTGLTNAGPSNIELMPLVTNTAYEPVPNFVKNWDIVGTDPFVQGTPNPRFPKAIRLMQHGILDGTDPGDFGLPGLRHEAPRRFAVAGDDILPGATLHLFVPDSTTAPNPTGALNQISTIEIILPIYPTYPRLEDGRQVWQTAVEAEPYIAYMLMLGGPKATGMPAVLNPVTVSGLAEPPSSSMFDVDSFNWHYVRVVNPNTNSADGGWQQLRLQ